MKKNMKMAVVAVVMAVTASTSFATDFGGPGSSMQIETLGVRTLEASVLTEMGADYGITGSEKDIAFTEQNGSSYISYIEQSGGAKNFAAVIQTGGDMGINASYIVQSGDNNHAAIRQSATTGVSNVAYASQTGSSNTAVINQK